MMQPGRSKFNLLLVDDDEDDYLIVKKLIEKITDPPFIVNWVSTFDDALAHINSGKYHIFLIDYMLGEQSGLKLLEEARPQERPEPFIILTGAGDQQIEQSAMRLGASDYIVKGSFDTDILSRSLRYALQRKRMEEQRIRNLLELNRAKDEFISLASHQLRTPATGVKQYIGMALDGYAGALTPQQESMLQKAYESNERQLQIVTDLLNVARIDSGKISLRPADTDLVVLIDDVLREQHSKFESRHQKIIFTHEYSEMFAAVDPENLRMALENLVDNASKYSEQGKTITVKLYNGFKSVVIDVIDEGVGIEKKDQDKLFQKFARLDNPLSTVVGGTGLGLYWVKKIVDLHKGSIRVFSKRGAGTTFRLRIPTEHKMPGASVR